MVRANASNELFFAVVGHVGSGNTYVGKLLETALSEFRPTAYQVVMLKARDQIIEWASKNDCELPEEPSEPNLHYAEALQDAGDEMRLRTGDNAAIARALVGKIRAARASQLGKALEEGKAVLPDGVPRAYILDSIRHPAEVELLRQVYQSAFTLIGVVCEEDIRAGRLHKKYSDGGESKCREFMRRDERADESHGQRVGDAFHRADVFLDNSSPRTGAGGESIEAFSLADQLSRVVRIMTHSGVVRPTIAETGMALAFEAKLRSACLSRQVGAALLDGKGNVIATGTNEAPRSGGGVYGQWFNDPLAPADARCAYGWAQAGESPYCSNTREREEIINDLIASVPQLAKERGNPQVIADIRRSLRGSRLGGLLEFSRAVHAEMDALLSAARKGISPVGARLFVTTYPCHYCARHIVAAGVDEVQFIEPYLKSKAIALHRDSITIEHSGWKAPSEGGTRVLFRPFTGVAPRMYQRAFLEDRELKDAEGRFSVGTPSWGGPWDAARVGYADLEAVLAKGEVDDSVEETGASS